MFSATLLVWLSMHAPPHAGLIDPVGTWRHSPDGTWTITAKGEGEYQAQESGLGHSSGTAHFTASGLFHLDYVTRDGTVVGVYDIRFSRDGRSAAGTVRELNGPRRSGTTNWAREVAPPPVAPATPSPPPPPAAVVDPVGTWRHSADGTWTIRAAGTGRFEAQETGLGYSSGPAYFTPSGTFRIEYQTRDRSITGIYELRFSPDGRTASGTVQELNGPRRSASTTWTRVAAAAPTPAPAPAAAPTVDPSGTWRHHPQATWTITRAADGRFFAQETGLGNSAGPAYFTQKGTFRIDFTTRDGSISGVYELRFSPDGRSATGTVQELNGPRRSGTTSWSR
jgi:hypothetical protein